jgi:protein SCO1
MKRIERHGEIRASTRFWIGGLMAAALLSPACSHAQDDAIRGGGQTPDRQAELMKKVRLDQKLDAQVPLDLTFRDETGQLVPLRRYFNGKPVMMNLIQYRCTMLCSEEMKVLASSLKELEFTPGKQFNLLTISIDDRELPPLAMEYRKGYLKQYARPGAEQGWHFLTGDKATIQRLADAIGYHFVYDAQTDQFAHPDGVIVVTPAGKIARYFFRLEYPAQGLRLALVEAAKEQIGSPLDYVALWCYHYNPTTGRYSLAIMKVLRLAALASVLGLATGVLLLNRRARSGPGGPPDSGSPEGPALMNEA